MTSRFIAKPPQWVTGKSLRAHLGQALIRFGVIVGQILVPFKSLPEEIEEFPVALAQVADEQVKQSQWIFDQAEERTVRLEQKAQSTFALMVFLVPIVASLFVFISSRVTVSGTPSRTSAGILLAMSSLCLLLGFISAVRAVSMRANQGLFLQSVLDDKGQFRKYDKAHHAYGLLYCAAINQAMNDHRAQFVKGAQLLTAVAVIGLVIAAIPAALIVSKLPSQAPETKIVGSVDITSAELRDLREEVKSLRADLQKALSNRQVFVDKVQQSETPVDGVESKDRDVTQSPTLRTKRKPQ